MRLPRISANVKLCGICGQPVEPITWRCRKCDMRHAGSEALEFRGKKVNRDG